MSALPDVLFERIDTDQLKIEAEQQREVCNRFMLKFAFAALIVAPNGDVLVAHHEAKEGEHEQGSLGTLMETYRYLPHVGRGVSEAPLQVFHRALSEELGIDEESYNKAGFFLDRQHPLEHRDWSGGARGGFNDFYAWTTSLIVRVDNPDVLVFDGRVSEEILRTEFRSIQSVLLSSEPTRLGYRDWLSKMQRRLSLPIDTSLHEPIRWTESPVTGKDVINPFEDN